MGWRAIQVLVASLARIMGILMLGSTSSSIIINLSRGGCEGAEEGRHQDLCNKGALGASR